MTWKPPRVSICLPVHNAQKHLRGCLKSVLSQTLTDFELIICDNASTDATESICRLFASKDSRIRYIKLSEKTEPAQNIGGGFELACGQYFLWHDCRDRLRPDFLAQCVKVLDDDPSIALVVPDTILIDDRRRHLQPHKSSVDADTNSAWRRFRRLLQPGRRYHRNYEIFGLMRWTALREAPLQDACTCPANADRVIIAQVGLLGRIHHLPEILFAPRSTPAHAFAQDGRWPVALQTWRLMRRYRRAVAWAPHLGIWQRIMCYMVLVDWTIRNSLNLVRDLVGGVDLAMERLLVGHGTSPSTVDAAPQGAHQMS